LQPAFQHKQDVALAAATASSIGHSALAQADMST